MAPPWKIPDEAWIIPDQAGLPGVPLREAKRKRSIPGGLTGNALFTGIISAIVAGIISFSVAHWQAQDAATQTIASQQVQQVIQVETDANTLYLVAYGAYVSRQECGDGNSSACKQIDTSLAGSPLISADSVLGSDLANISDAAIRLDAENFQLSIHDALPMAGTSQGNAAMLNVGTAYGRLLTRCGQVVQGR